MSNIQILNVILWQKNGFTRNLEFRPNSVNVITGDSGKGKSSILYIIDYCLLASKTTGISKTNIDSKVDWYGIKLSVDGRRLVIARPSESKGESDQAYFSEHGEIPEVPELNVRIDNLKKVLSGAFGIDTEMKVPYGGRHIRAGSRMSYRNFLAYSYQDQNTVVAPDYLYIRPADGRYQEAIERTFRMAIGAETVDTAIARGRLAELERKRVVQDRKYKAYARAVSTFSEEVGALSEEAHSFGLIGRVPDTYEDKLTELKRVLDGALTPIDHDSAVENIESEIFSLAAKNRRLQAFIDDRGTYTESLKESADSLKPVNVFNIDHDDIFPSKFANQVIMTLQNELADIKASLRGRTTFPFLDEVKDMLGRNNGKIEQLRKELDLNHSKKDTRSNPSAYYRYLGRLEAKIDIYKKVEVTEVEAADDALEDAIDDLRAAVERNKDRTDLAKQELNRLINKRLARLPLKGYKDFSAFYQERDKQIHLYSPDLTTEEKMPDVGSASNYLYLHIAHFLAIHEIAKLRQIPWVASFLVLDQVSTPYFSSDGKPNDDIRSLDKVLSELNQFVADMDTRGGFQIILLEHLVEEHWTRLNLDRFHLVDRELRDDYGLILSDIGDV